LTVFAQHITLEEMITLALQNSDVVQSIEIQKSMQEKQYLLVKRSWYPTLQMGISGPAYNHSISPVTQPDGNVKYLDVFSLNASASTSIFMPIIFTGGSISIQSSFNFYQNANERTFSSNFYKVSLSQPLSGFNLYRLEQKAALANFKVQTVASAREYIDLKKVVSQYYFDIIDIKSRMSILSRQKEITEKLLEIYLSLYEQQKIKEVELIELQIYKNEILDNLEYAEKEEKRLVQEFTDIIGNDIDSYTLEMPEMLKIDISIDIALLYLQNIQNLYNDATLATGKQQLAKVKSQTGINGQINLGIGSNTSANDIRYLPTNEVNNENLSISLTIPILDWGKRKYQKQIANLDFEKRTLEQKNQFEKQQNHLIANIERYNFCKLRHQRLEERHKLLEKNSEIILTLFEYNQVNFKQFEETQIKIIENEKQLVNEIKNAYLAYYDIEFLTLFDFIHNQHLSESCGN
jgi:outer membrane protein TolC